MTTKFLTVFALVGLTACGGSSGGDRGPSNPEIAQAMAGTWLFYFNYCSTPDVQRIWSITAGAGDSEVSIEDSYGVVADGLVSSSMLAADTTQGPLQLQLVGDRLSGTFGGTSDCFEITIQGTRIETTDCPDIGSGTWEVTALAADATVLFEISGSMTQTGCGLEWAGSTIPALGLIGGLDGERWTPGANYVHGWQIWQGFVMTDIDVVFTSDAEFFGSAVNSVTGEPIALIGARL